MIGYAAISSVYMKPQKPDSVVKRSFNLCGVRLRSFARSRPVTVIIASIFPILFVGVIIVGLMFLAAVFTPKGPNQVYVLLPLTNSRNRLTRAS